MIEHTKVFWWTTAWSMWSHLWIWIVYKKLTPGHITMWQAFVTLGQMPLFIYTTWLVRDETRQPKQGTHGLSDSSSCCL